VWISFRVFGPRGGKELGLDGIGLWLGKLDYFLRFFRCLDESWKWYDLIFVIRSCQISSLCCL
jgi:hypothetical protein